MRQKIAAYLGLFILIACFAVADTTDADGFFSFLNFQSLIGSFGCLQLPGGEPLCDITPRNGSGAKAGFIYCLGLIPPIMITCGILEVLSFWHTGQAAQSLFSRMVRLLSGLPGSATVAMFVSLQSSDAGAAATRELHSRGELTDEERDVLAMWQFSSSGTLINVFSNGLALLPLIVVPLGNILLVIVAAKFLGANLLRLFLWTRKSKSLKLP